MPKVSSADVGVWVWSPRGRAFSFCRAHRGEKAAALVRQRPEWEAVMLSGTVVGPGSAIPAVCFVPAAQAKSGRPSASGQFFVAVSSPWSRLSLPATAESIELASDRGGFLVPASSKASVMAAAAAGRTLGFPPGASLAAAVLATAYSPAATGDALASHVADRLLGGGEASASAAARAHVHASLAALDTCPPDGIAALEAIRRPLSVDPSAASLPAKAVKAALKPLGAEVASLTLGAALQSDPGALALLLSDIRPLEAPGRGAARFGGEEEEDAATAERDGGASGSPSETDAAAVRSALATMGAGGLASALPDDMVDAAIRSVDNDAAAAAVLLISQFS